MADENEIQFEDEPGTPIPASGTPPARDAPASSPPTLPPVAVGAGGPVARVTPGTQLARADSPGDEIEPFGGATGHQDSAGGLERVLLSPGFRWGTVLGFLGLALAAPSSWTWVPAAFLLSWLWAMLSPIYPYMLYRQGQFRRCADLQRILRDSSLLSSNRAIHGLNLASALSQLGRAEEALHLLEGIPPEDIPRRHRKVHYINRILFCLRLGDLERARQLLADPPDELPSWLDPYLDLSRASLALQEGRPRECVHMLEHSRPLNRASDLRIAAAGLKADALLEVGRFADALPMARSALKDPRVRPGAQILVAESLLCSGADISEVLDHLTRACEESARLSVRGQALLYLQLAHVFYRLDLPDGGEEFRRRLGELGLTSPTFQTRVTRYLAPFRRAGTPPEEPLALG